MSDKSNKVSVFYGRARRIELYEKLAYIAVVVVAVIIIVVLVSKQPTDTDRNINFSYLRDYLQGRGYSCELLHQNNGGCTKRTDNTLYNFVRFEDGFMYTVKTDSYLMQIVHSLEKSESITFSTTSEAFLGYRNKKYYCELGESVLDTFGDCLTKDGEVLNLNSYRGIIEQAQFDVSNMLDASGYYKNTLLEDYVWQKK